MGWNQLQRQDQPAYLQGKDECDPLCGNIERIPITISLSHVWYISEAIQDNDPKHCSATARHFFEDERINWWRTPPESPDLNAIELVWHKLKEYIRREIKPTSKEQLVLGIQEFWKTMTVAKCNRYIDHLKKVVPEVIKRNGKATGY